MLLAREFADWIDADPRFELLMPPPFALVCFRSVPPPGRDADAWNRRLLGMVNARGPVFLSHTVVEEEYILRMAIGSARNTASAVRTAYDLLGEEYDRLADATVRRPSGP
jgi:glutamate/tyrosine decarboxylase-like PLP-dependent enzyme